MRDHFTRKEAARYLTEMGYPITWKTLSNRASNGNAGDGPPYSRYGWRRVLYARADLDAWLKRKLASVERVE